MKVSVVIPTHNRTAWLELTVRSVLRQHHADLEAIVVDDGSTDDTPELLSRMADPRVRVIRHDSSQGVAASRNHGAAEARGEWIGFVDDDDVWAPDKLARQLDAADATGRTWVYAGVVHVDDDTQRDWRQTAATTRRRSSPGPSLQRRARWRLERDRSARRVRARRSLRRAVEEHGGLGDVDPAQRAGTAGVGPATARREAGARTDGLARRDGDLRRRLADRAATRNDRRPRGPPPVDRGGVPPQRPTARGDQAHGDRGGSRTGAGRVARRGDDPQEAPPSRSTAHGDAGDARRVGRGGARLGRRASADEPVCGGRRGPR